ncbi:MAG: hypothetical protein M1402_05655 [Candidatus Thermoplasmatota archaeon]|jgi:hypothetical protein|nr:hypothetical protein [Candidatus Thermoplasmatota archaeon]
MTDTSSHGKGMRTLITVVVGIVLLVLGGYFMGLEIAAALSHINGDLLIAGLIIFFIGIILLAMEISRIFHKRDQKQ